MLHYYGPAGRIPGPLHIVRCHGSAVAPRPEFHALCGRGRPASWRAMPEEHARTRRLCVTCLRIMRSEQ